MNVSHTMDEAQVKRISEALKSSAAAIEGINKKFETIDEHIRQIEDFNGNMNTKVEKTLESFHRLDSTFNDRAECVLEAMIGGTEHFTVVMQKAVMRLQKINIRRELDAIPKAIIPLVIPLIILLVELSVANAYIGILLSSLDGAGARYSNYLLGNASLVLLGLTGSLMWLGFYRISLSWHGTDGKRMSVKNFPTRVLGIDSDSSDESDTAEPQADMKSAIPMTDLRSLRSERTKSISFDCSVPDERASIRRRTKFRRRSDSPATSQPSGSPAPTPDFTSADLMANPRVLELPFPEGCVELVDELDASTSGLASVAITRSSSSQNAASEEEEVECRPPPSSSTSRQKGSLQRHGPSATHTERHDGPRDSSACSSISGNDPSGRGGRLVPRVGARSLGDMWRGGRIELNAEWVRQRNSVQAPAQPAPASL